MPCGKGQLEEQEKEAAIYEIRVCYYYNKNPVKTRLEAAEVPKGSARPPKNTDTFPFVELQISLPEAMPDNRSIQCSSTNLIFFYY